MRTSRTQPDGATLLPESCTSPWLPAPALSPTTSAITQPQISQPTVRQPSTWRRGKKWFYLDTNGRLRFYLIAQVAGQRMQTSFHGHQAIFFWYLAQIKPAQITKSHYW